MSAPVTTDQLPRLACQLMRPDAAAEYAQHPGLLAAIHVDAKHNRIDDDGQIHVSLHSLNEAQVELWLSNHPLRSERIGAFQVRHDGQWCMGAALFDDSPNDNPQRNSAAAYDDLQRVLRELDYPHLWRTWNYFPAINTEVDGLERYRAFVLGRHDALSQPQAHEQFPAATAIGSQGNGLLVYFLAARTAATQVENPRQTSAFHYPEHYGPRSPSFSRAVSWRSEQQSGLLISGTASIVGHESLHDSSEEQLNEVLRNIHSVVGEAQLDGVQGLNELDCVKLYCRRAEDWAALSSAWPDNIRVQALLGDVCRSDLLVEIEALSIRDQRA